MEKKSLCISLDEASVSRLKQLMCLRCSRSRSQIVREALLLMTEFYFGEKVSHMKPKEKNNG